MNTLPLPSQIIQLVGCSLLTIFSTSWTLEQLWARFWNWYTYLTAMKWNQIQSSSKENIIFVAVFCTTRHVKGSEEVWLVSYLLVFGQIRNFLFHHNLKQLRDSLFSLHIHFDWTNSAWFVFYMNVLLSKMYLIDFTSFLFFFSFSVKSYQCNIIIHQLI